MHTKKKIGAMLMARSFHHRLVVIIMSIRKSIENIRYKMSLYARVRDETNEHLLKRPKSFNIWTNSSLDVDTINLKKLLLASIGILIPSLHRMNQSNLTFYVNSVCLGGITSYKINIKIIIYIIYTNIMQSMIQNFNLIIKIKYTISPL